ncbi:MAG TPA: FimV/HubP family polar landmark protein [Rhodanobacteraceae bacterium]|nr:FimV/HubP family polar landmark protein [Rhodanobacteraceae bacterium]
MKRPLQISLAIALASLAADAFALGLGPVHVESGLNQPLTAEIPIIEGSPGEADGLVVQLATADDFDRVGLDRARISIPLEFAVAKNARGQPVVKVTSDQAIHEPFLDFLIEANWPKGRLLREYTVLLDPPVTAPATQRGTAVTAAARAPAQTTRRPLTPAKPAASATATPATSAREGSRAATRASSAGTYGPVAAGETLSSIVRNTRADPTVDINRMMLAMLEANPDAFFKDNINNLKRGAILRIPSAEEIAAVGSAAAAAAKVRSQVEQWRASAPAKPTLVAGTGAAQAPSTGAGAAVKAGSAERLELLPPKSGAVNRTTAGDHPGSAKGSSTAAVASTRLNEELSRTKETLSSREQENQDLKSRVAQLEDLKNKNERMIGLKDSEIADLQQKLKALQQQSEKIAAAKASGKPAPGPANPESRENIFGNAAAPAGSAAPPTPKPVPEAPVTTVTAPPPGGGAVPTAEPGASGAVNVPEAPLPAVTPTPARPASVPPPSAGISVATPAKPEARTSIQPLAPAARPWYVEPWAKTAAIAIGLLVIILGLLGLLRSRKGMETAPATGRSIAGAFGDSPLSGGGAEADARGAEALDEDTEEERVLREQIRQDPADLGLHLELLSLYYAQRDVGKFEAAAQEMAAYVDHPEQPEWQQVKAMSEELAPGNLLSSDAAVTALTDAEGPVVPASDTSFFDFDRVPAIEPGRSFESGADQGDDFADEASGATTGAESGFEFDHEFDDEVRPQPAVPAAASDSISFAEEDSTGDLPPLAFEHDNAGQVEADEGDRRGTVEPAHPAPIEVERAEDFVADEEPTGTKLDLARAYLDMGDPEGARSMLEEVLAEGSAAQRDDARKLMEEIG